jgi:hypothetical protein
MMPNPNELARLEDELDYLKAELEGYKVKSVKEQVLREIRTIERQLGIESKPYNGS